MARPLVTVRDVTLREFGQNVPASAVDELWTERRLWLARELLQAGFRTIEVASTASPVVAPAMAAERLRPFLDALGSPAGIELITLVPSSRGYRRFTELGLGPDGLAHTMGVFLSAMDAHNLANLRCTVDESLEALSTFVSEARREGVQVVGYVSAAFGFLPGRSAEVVGADLERVAELIARLADLGASTVTLSDLQGLAGPTETEDRLGELINGRLASPVPLGYHPHHVDPDRALENVRAAAAAGVRLFDASLGAVGGCVTGAPGNAPTEGVVATLESVGLRTGLDAKALVALSRETSRRVFEPVISRST